MSKDYLVYEKSKLNKKISDANADMFIEGYLIDNFDFFIEKFKVPALPLILGDTFDNGILTAYTYDKEEYDNRYEFWRFNGYEVFEKFRDMVNRNVNKVKSNQKALINSIDDLENILPKILELYKQGYIFEISV